MAQIILKKGPQNIEEQEEEFIVLSPLELQRPMHEVSKPQAKPQISIKKGLVRLLKKGKFNAKYLGELVDVKQVSAKLDTRSINAPISLNF